MLAPLQSLFALVAYTCVKLSCRIAHT